MPKIAVTNAQSECKTKATMIAKELQLPYVDLYQPSIYDYWLVVSSACIYLKINQVDAKPFYIDFADPSFLYRLKRISMKNELIAKAMGAKPKQGLSIVDATAGLGRDGFILAALGFKVTLLERSPVLFILLKDALERARKNTFLQHVVDRITLIHADSIRWLTKKCYTIQPDIIYLDPMFPERQKSAQVKREMILLQSLVGKDIDADDLFKKALACAAKRVVIKRPKLAGNFSECVANYSIIGKKNRFDIYLT